MILLCFLATFILACASDFFEEFRFSSLENNGNVFTGVYRQPFCVTLKDQILEVGVSVVRTRFPAVDGFPVDWKESEVLKLFYTKDGSLPPQLEHSFLGLEYRLFLREQATGTMHFFQLHFNSLEGQFSIESYVTSSLLNEHDVDELRIVSFNLWNFNKNWRHRCRAIARLVHAASADIVLLQEVRYDQRFARHHPRPPTSTETSGDDVFQQSGSQAEHFHHCLLTEAAETEQRRDSSEIWNFVSERAMYYLHYDEPPNIWVDCEGLAVFTRLPLRARHFKRLPRFLKDRADEHQRILLDVSIDISPQQDDRPNNFFRAMTTHLSLSSQARLASVEEIASHIESLGGADALHAVLTGDLNANPSSKSVSLLASRLSEQLLDVWADDESSDAYTFENDPQRPSRLRKRIDYIFLSHDYTIQHRQLIGRKASWTRTLSDDGAWVRELVPPSDHHGVYVRMKKKLHL